MQTQSALKAISDDTRFKIIELLLRRNYCVGALADLLLISEAAVSQHIKVLRDADLLVGEKKGYYMHYKVNHCTLRQLAREIDMLCSIQRQGCAQTKSPCRHGMGKSCGTKESGGLE